MMALLRDMRRANSQNYSSFKEALDKAQKFLDGWTKLLDDPKKFQPLIKRQWELAFDARERAAIAACRSDPRAFAADYPFGAVLIAALGLER